MKFPSIVKPLSPAPPRKYDLPLTGEVITAGNSRFSTWIAVMADIFLV
jgi:hypothetical protein